ncbi:MBL fold metallo-hydrolase [Paraglaciecola chathamensis]|uniref:MBL fold metallo-hydrolase n=1 Tax=Paraglaciecola chathamensis TaxID=368405 RepID=A0A8H9LY99_9ALTE|nr:MBL fold metallo-hydrolase [Paraglaciecola oceanifecundans]GGZ47760.1 MBL fold metallo-hydrolase [Paraglaciecola oceanifecundans]
MKSTKLARGLFLSSSLALSCFLPTQAFAQDNVEASSSSGFYRTQLGQFTVVALSDGTVDLPMDKLLHQDAEKTKQQLAKAFLSVPTETSVNGYLIDTGNEVLLVDTGAGSLFGPTLGKITSSLQAAGYSPSDVNHILITHLHPDHVGGLAKDGQRVFENATIHAGQADLDFWLSKAQMDKAPKDSKGFFQGAMASLNPYVSADKVKGLQGDEQIVPGIKTDATHGHTPGHTSYMVSSEGQEMWVIGDLIHAGAVQFPHPETTIDFDSAPEQAKAQRLRVFSTIANSEALVAGAHLQFPGLGHLRKTQSGFHWVPENFRRLR